MGIWNLLTSKRTKLKQLAKLTDSNSAKIKKLHSDFTAVKNSLDANTVLLIRHDQLISQHGQMLDKQSQQIKSLEQIVAEPSPDRTVACLTPLNEQVREKPSAINQPLSNPAISSNGMVEMNRFSPQEKKILSVFFQHPEMPLSYKDISQFLHKSANTIKNQVRQIRMKADLFTQSTDQENRNRFRLKKGLQIDNILNLKQTTSDTDRAD